MKRLLDADVLIGALDGDDAHHDRARELLTGWRQQEDAVRISVVNLAEVLIGPASDPARLATARQAIAALGVAVHLPSEAIGVEAARLRHRHPVSLADAYCLATAKRTSSSLASFDPRVLKAARREGLETV